MSVTTNAPILELGDVCVTNTKVAIGSTSYFVANITSVRLVEDNNVRTYGIITAVVGALLVVGAIGSSSALGIVVGLIGAAAGGLMYRYGVTWELVLTTGASERQALRSQDRANVVRVLAAINVAVESRATAR
jgi:hypothetical protein